VPNPNIPFTLVDTLPTSIIRPGSNPLPTTVTEPNPSTNSGISTEKTQISFNPLPTIIEPDPNVPFDESDSQKSKNMIIGLGLLISIVVLFTAVVCCCYIKRKRSNRKKSFMLPSSMNGSVISSNSRNSLRSSTPRSSIQNGRSSISIGRSSYQSFNRSSIHQSNQPMGYQANNRSSIQPYHSRRVQAQSLTVPASVHLPSIPRMDTSTRISIDGRYYEQDYETDQDPYEDE
jgi:hypothetical protein